MEYPAPRSTLTPFHNATALPKELPQPPLPKRSAPLPFREAPAQLLPHLDPEVWYSEKTFNLPSILESWELTERMRRVYEVTAEMLQTAALRHLPYNAVIIVKPGMRGWGRTCSSGRRGDE